MGDRQGAHTNHLIVFTRYPQPGTAKTRLIPALGAEGAAQVSRQLTEHTLAQITQFCQQDAIAVTIACAGGSVSQMQQWLGQHWQYVPQTGEDLGDRMAKAMHAAFAGGAQRVLIIGTMSQLGQSRRLRAVGFRSNAAVVGAAPPVASISSHTGAGFRISGTLYMSVVQ